MFHASGTPEVKHSFVSWGVRAWQELYRWLECPERAGGGAGTVEAKRNDLCHNLEGHHALRNYIKGAFGK